MYIYIRDGNRTRTEPNFSNRTELFEPNPSFLTFYTEPNLIKINSEPNRTIALLNIEPNRTELFLFSSIPIKANYFLPRHLSNIK